jgi:hypothetical protein
MDERLDGVVSLSSQSVSAEERMLKGDLVREMVARKERGEGIKRCQGGAANLPAHGWPPPIQFIVSFRYALPMQSDETKSTSQ